MKNQIILEFTGGLDKDNIKLFENKILAKQEDIKLQNNKTLLVSLSNIAYKNSLDNLELFINQISNFTKAIGIGIGFIDYSTDLYSFLRSMSQNTQIQLYKTKEIAGLFLNPSSFNKNTSVLVFDEDTVNSKQLYVELSQNDYKLVRAKTIEEFFEAVKEEEYDFVITKTFLNKSTLEMKFTLSKKLIMNLPVFMNKAAETLCTFTGLDAEKKSHSISTFDTKLNTKTISAVMPFKGDLEGSFTLVFPSDIAIIALEALLGETVSEDDTDTLQDGVGEFCNIITGATKTEFDTRDIKVIFDLPKTYVSLEDTQKHIGINKGIWMNMQLSGKPFYMFVNK